MKTRTGIAVLFAVILTLLLANPVQAATDLSRLTRLDDVSLYEEKGEARLVLRFAKEWKTAVKPKFFEKSIQYDIKGVYISPAKREFSFNSSFIKTAAAYQIAPNHVRLRLFLRDDPRNFQKGYRSSFNNNLFVLRFTTPDAAVSTVSSAPVPAAEKIRTVARKESVADEAEMDAARRLELAAFRRLAKTSEKHTAALKQGLIKERKSVSSFSASDVSKSRKGDFSNLFVRNVEAKGKEASPSHSQSGNKIVGASGAVPGYAEPQIPKAPSMGAAILKMVSALALCLGLLFLMAWIAKRYKGSIHGAFGSGGVVTVLATGAIGVKKQVVVVDVAGEVMALGVSDGAVSMLKVIDDQETADRLRRIGSGATPLRSAKERLGKIGSKSRKGKKGLFARLKKSSERIEEIADPVPPPPAVMDATDPDTFAGALGALTDKAEKQDGYMPRSGKVETRDEARKRPARIEVKGEELQPSREELMAKAMSAIRKQSGSLKIA